MLLTLLTSEATVSLHANEVTYKENQFELQVTHMRKGHEALSDLEKFSSHFAAVPLQERESFVALI